MKANPNESDIVMLDESGAIVAAGSAVVIDEPRNGIRATIIARFRYAQTR